jgi:ABC-type transport system involved in multi-copper enzyme maturation permease subunit
MLALFQFFLKYFIRSRRMFWMLFLGMIPVFTVLLLYGLKLFGLLHDFIISSLFPKLALSMYLHFLLPLMAVFIGTSVIIDEVESATLPYLLVRPIPRWQIIFSKTLASEVLLALILTVSLLITYLLMLPEGIQVSGITLLFYVLVLVTGSFTYVGLFSFVGGIVRKPVLTSLLFTFGWEKIVGSLPGSLRYLTVIYYLNSLFPFKERTTTASIFSLLRVNSSTITTWKALFILVLIIVFFHFLAVSLLSWKEYAHQDE